jgi:hypothetical protein
MQSFGFNGTLLHWFTNYLTHRQQRVVIEGHSSRLTMVKSGVPQGSILGPLLFNYYINDLFKCVTDTNCTLFLYADDAKIGYGIKDNISCHNLQNELNNVVNWSKKWGMLFNVNKCVLMSLSYSPKIVEHNYYINNSVVTRVNNFTDLGITINSRLKWDGHINSCVKKANQKLGLIKRITGYTCSTDVKLLCYTSIVRPHLEFSSQMWSCHSKKLLLSIESVQRRATKFILNDFISDYHTRLSLLSLLPLSLRRNYLDLVFFFNCVHDLVDINTEILPLFIVHDNIRTRQDHDDHLVHSNRVRSHLYECSFTQRIGKIWNTLPYELRKIELTAMGHNSTFKRELKLHIFNFMNTEFDVNNTCKWVLKCDCNNCRMY